MVSMTPLGSTAESLSNFQEVIKLKEHWDPERHHYLRTKEQEGFELWNKENPQLAAHFFAWPSQACWKPLPRLPACSNNRAGEFSLTTSRCHRYRNRLQYYRHGRDRRETPPLDEREEAEDSDVQLCQERVGEKKKVVNIAGKEEEERPDLDGIPIRATAARYNVQTDREKAKTSVVFEMLEINVGVEGNSVDPLPEPRSLVGTPRFVLVRDCEGESALEDAEGVSYENAAATDGAPFTAGSRGWELGLPVGEDDWRDEKTANRRNSI